MFKIHRMIVKHFSGTRLYLLVVTVHLHTTQTKTISLLSKTTSDFKEAKYLFSLQWYQQRRKKERRSLSTPVYISCEGLCRNAPATANQSVDKAPRQGVSTNTDSKVPNTDFNLHLIPNSNYTVCR